MAFYRLIFIVQIAQTEVGRFDQIETGKSDIQ